LKKLKNKGVAEPPTLAGLGWLNHPPWGGSGGGSATPKGQTLQILFFPFCPYGSRTTPIGHGGGSATHRPATPVALRGGLATPKGKTNLTILLLLLLLFFVQGVAEPPHATPDRAATLFFF